MKIKRDIFESLEKWKNKKNRKPLILNGARQTGKTWTLRHFGNHSFGTSFYINMDEERSLGEIFQTTKDPHRIIENLQYYAGLKFNPEQTLIIIDEIQECPSAIESLKYFCEKAPEYPIATAGSLLGISYGHKGSSFPVGKTDRLELYPITFSEFLGAKDSSLYHYYHSIRNIEPIPQIFFDKLNENFNIYRICGGMPEAVTTILEDGIEASEHIIKMILDGYSLDFVKHSSPVVANRTRYVWNSLPSQLAKENRKFIYGHIKSGARAREYEDSIMWLRKAGLIYQVFNCSTPKLPLKAYEQLNAFKIYVNDIGILRCLSELDASVFHSEHTQFKEFKGALNENYILQSLVSQFGSNLHYWTSENTAEIDFILQFENHIIPIEVKSGESTKAKSLALYNAIYNPVLRIRYSMKNLSYTDNLLNIPLFLADRTTDFIAYILKQKEP